MITINATGDTTLHTAGKYCEEDILVRVPETESTEDISAEVAEYTDLNAELEEVINSLPDAGSGSGGVDTCTVTFSTSYGYFTNYAFTCLVSGKITTVSETVISSTSCTVENVICGSCFQISMMADAIAIQSQGGVDQVHGSSMTIFTVTATNGSTATLNFYNPF